MSETAGSDGDNGCAHGPKETTSITRTRQQIGLFGPSSILSTQYSDPYSTHSSSPPESSQRSVPISSLLTNRSESPSGKGSLTSPDSTQLPPFDSILTRHDEPFDKPPQKMGEYHPQGTRLWNFGSVTTDSNEPPLTSKSVPDLRQSWTGKRPRDHDEAQRITNYTHQYSVDLGTSNRFSREIENPEDPVIESSLNSATSRFYSTAYPTNRIPEVSQGMRLPSFPQTYQNSEIETRISGPPALIYVLKIRQHPAAARACGYGERDRRLIDPPPILELQIRDRTTLESVNDPTAMLALHCDLIRADHFEDTKRSSANMSESDLSRQLIGTLMAPPHNGKDEAGSEGIFFVFSDLSCRLQGHFRLYFKLLRIDPSLLTPGAVHPCVAAVSSDVFTVYTAKTFPGMQASSSLLRSLRSQGLNVSVRKGSSQRRSSQPDRTESESDEDDGRAGVADSKRRIITPVYTANYPEDGRQSPDRVRGKRRKTISGHDSYND